jgi:hypothetical protein
MQPVALRLVCYGAAAKANSSLHQQGKPSLIPELSELATLHISGLVYPADGVHEAVYEGRGRHRDVYRVGRNFVLKLLAIETDQIHNNHHREAAALQETRHLPQTPILYYHGSCTIERHDSITLTAQAVLVSYGGQSLNNLMHKHFAQPYDHVVANFFVSAYHDLVLMIMDGIQLQIAYHKLHSANVTTLSDPTMHVAGQRVPCMMVGSEGVKQGSYSRNLMNSQCDGLLEDFQLQCEIALDHSWRFLGWLIQAFFHLFFNRTGDMHIMTAKALFVDQFKGFWESVGVESTRSHSTVRRIPGALPYDSDATEA